MASSSPSGKGGAGHVLELVCMNHNKNIIRQQARDKSELELEAIWAKRCYLV